MFTKEFLRRYLISGPVGSAAGYLLATLAKQDKDVPLILGYLLGVYIDLSEAQLARVNKLNEIIQAG